jgi:putative transposase
MFKAYQALMLVLAQATEKELAAQVQYLKAENQILRARLPKRILVTPVERRRLLKLGRPLGAAIDTLITIVTPGTFVRWIREANGNKPARNIGRPKHRQAIRDLVVQITKETSWGYTRVLGELRKLTKRKVSRQTVVNMMRENGLNPGPKRGEKTWDEFVKIHAQTLWQCDFFSKQVWILKGLREYFVLAFIHVDTRKVFVSTATAHPNSEWVVEQANAFCRHVETEGAQADLVFHDSVRKRCQAFDDALKANGMRVRRPRPLSPNLNAFVERWIQSIKQECLDHFIVLGGTHLNHLVSEYVHYYQTERPHQGIDIGNELLVPMKPPDENVPAPDQLVCRERLGGLLKSYSRRAA